MNIDTLDMEFDMNTLDKKVVEAFGAKLENRRNILDDDGAVLKTTGNFHNYKVDCNRDRIYLNGSLTKYYHGNNVESLSRDQLRTALKQLCEETGLPIYMARLVRIDVAVNIAVEHKPKLYFKHLLKTNGYVRTEKPVRLAFDKGQGETPNSFVFYDKMKELSRNNRPLYNHMKGLNIIRIEDRYLKRTRKQLMPTVKVLRVGHLLSNKLQRVLVQRWLAHYHKIEKKANIYIPHYTEKATDIWNALAAMGVKAHGGIVSVMDLIDEIAMLQNWNAVKRSKAKRLVKDKFKQSTISAKKSHYITELDFLIDGHEDLNLWRAGLGI